MSNFWINFALSVLFALVQEPVIDQRFRKALIKLRDKLIAANLDVLP